MSTRIPHPTQKIITGQQKTTGYLQMQKKLGGYYLQNFFNILDEQHKSGRFLEVGSGSGFQTAEIAQKYPQAEIVALEPSADMISVASDYLAQRGLLNRVRFVEGTLEDQELVHSLGEFDLVYSSFSLHHWADPVCAFRNLFHVLKPGGVFLIYDFQRDWLLSCIPSGNGIMESIRASYTPQEIKSFLRQADIYHPAVNSRSIYLSIVVAKQNDLIFANKPVKQLAELEHGQAGQIVSIQSAIPERIQELRDMGITPNAIVRVIETYTRHVIFTVGHKKIVADKIVASEIIVQVLSPSRQMLAGF